MLYYARGSLFETKYWLNRCKIRQLISETNANDLTNRLGEIARQINAFVNHLKTQRRDKSEKSLRESIADYETRIELPIEIIDAVEFAWLVSDNPYLEPPFSLQSLVSGLNAL